MGTHDVEVSMVVDADRWREVEGEAPTRGRAWWGVDLGTSAAQSAVAAYWPASGRLDVVAAFPREPSLQKRGLADGVGRLYLDCHRRGELHLSGDLAVHIPDLLRIALRRFGAPAGIACDRWREAELREAAQGVLPVVPVDTRGWDSWTAARTCASSGAGSRRARSRRCRRSCFDPP